MLAWSEGTDNGRQKTEIMVMTSLWASYLLITPITLLTCHAKLGTQIKRRGRCKNCFPVGGCLRPTTLKDFY